MAPVVHELCRRPERFNVRLVFTGQHRELLQQASVALGLSCDRDLGLMRDSQSLSSIMSRVIEGLDGEIVSFAPDIAIAQGDTATVASTALACYHRQVPFAHVEAGLRTSDLYSPFPEEGYRRLVGTLATLHFAPTSSARAALLRENIPDERIFVTGNTSIDSLLKTAQRGVASPIELRPNRLLTLVTMHRRESFDGGLARVCETLRQLVSLHPDVDLVFPVHPNPKVRGLVYERLGSLPNVHLIEPVAYDQFVALMSRAALILTDSGGVQEEAPSFGVPILVLRDTTERPEGIEAGCAELVGTDAERILARADFWLRSHRRSKVRRIPASPYGDGHASERIAEVIWNYFAAEPELSLTSASIR